MTRSGKDAEARLYMEKAELGRLIDILKQQGYTVIGPMVQEGVVRLGVINNPDELAGGVVDDQEGGHYRLRSGDPRMYFDTVVGPDSPKRYFSPMEEELFTFHVKDKQFVIDKGTADPPRLAFIGVRPCELAAMDLLDRAHGYDDRTTFRCESDPYYGEARRHSLFIAVHCTRPGGTCFCESMGTGPRAKTGFDLALTELDGGFVIDVGSDRGEALANDLSLRGATESEQETATLKLDQARENMGRRLNTDGIVDLLNQTIDDPTWDEIATRCLSCGNCTLVCPSCFCCTVSDTTDLSGTSVTRTRRWDSCFTHEFSYTTGGPQRHSVRGRYRHWLRHKLGTWWEQFGTSGCVGCGRCITWCPVGIDLTSEVDALRKTHSGVTKNRPPSTGQKEFDV